MTITRDTVDEIRKNVIELTKTYAEALSEQFAAMGPGMRRMSDDEFVAWFTMKVEENPNWALALPFVEGGMDELRRWERIQEERAEGATYG